MSKSTTSSGFSFGFSKKKESKTLKKNNLISEKTEDNNENEKEILESFDGKQIKRSDDKDLHKDLVIPMKQGSNWWRPKKPDDLEAEEEGKDKKEAKVASLNLGEGVDSAVAREIIEEARARNEDWEARGKKDLNMTIPLQSVDATDEEERRGPPLPENAEDADYESVPIEAFGKGLLRGMGWKEGQGVGKNNKNVKPVDAVLRPKGLGLGADRSQAAQKEGKTATSRDGEEMPEVDAELKRGVCCVIIGGKHKDRYGTVEGLDEDNNRVLIKLTVGSEILTLSQMAVKAVSRKEYDKYSKYLNKGKTDKYKEDQAAKEKRESDQHGDRYDHHHRSNDRHRSHENTPERRRDSNEKHKDRDRDRHLKRKPERNERSSSSSNKKSKHSTNGHAASSVWLRAHLKVRIICPEYKKGKYFKTKVAVEDVISGDSCICRTDEGRVLEELSQSMLETVIPKSEGSYVMVVHGKYRGMLGEVLQKDKSRCMAGIQLLQDRDKLVQLDFDDICEYVGDITQEDDY